MKTANKSHQAQWYVPLAAHFNKLDGAMPLYQFASIEAILYLLHQTAPLADARKAYLLFSEYHLIGTEHCNAEEHILQKARLQLGYYRSQKAWQDVFSLYCGPKYDAFRAFVLTKREDGSISAAPSAQPYPYGFEQRKAEWKHFWEDAPRPAKALLYAGNGRYQYFRNEAEEQHGETTAVMLCDAQPRCTIPEASCKGPRSPIRISLEDLLTVSRQMKELNPADYCHQVLKTNQLKLCKNNTVTNADSLELDGVTNVVGMVGSGKSTLIKVLACWCHCHDRKVAIVVDTVAEVLNLWSYLHGLNVSCSPLVGKSERLKYINQIAAAEQTHLMPALSQYMTPACLIDGMDDSHTDALTFGKEPCFSLKSNGKSHLCPYFDVCKGTKMLRDCYHSSVVITTVAGFAASRVGWNKELFLDLVMREFDLVIFDECDRVQKTLDQLFMPETRFNQYIQESAPESRHFMEQSNKERFFDPVRQKYNEMQHNSVTVLYCVVESLNRQLGSWNKIAMQDPFSALILLDDLYQKKTPYQIPKAVYDTLYELIDMKWQPNQENPWRKALQACCLSMEPDLFEALYQDGVKALGRRFPRPADERERRIQDNRIQLILRLICFDHFVEDLRAAYEASHETSYGQNELFGFLQSRFRQQQDLLPSSLCGNLFGLKRTDEDDLLLFRQFAFGRSLMKDLPWLTTDPDGKPAGPHVMLLSGSSWAKGSYEYHVNRPVSYILESDSEKREFLAGTGFHESGFPERVSGAAPDQRCELLRQVTRKSAPWIISELSRSSEKILLVVNSYDQARLVQETLKQELASRNCSAGICRMISDAKNDQDETGTIRRGEVSKFAGRPEKILIAPAMAIERGHNIVDEAGHSALGAVFFLVRPMAVPDDIQQTVSKLNGYVEAQCRRGTSESVFDYNQRIRQFASTRWKQMVQSKAYGLNELENHEKRDIVATLFILILQIFGRLARVTDLSRTAPQIYFMDGAFRGRETVENDFDCLNELGKFLDEMMNDPQHSEIAKTLYGPFYQSYKKGGLYHG